MVGLGAASQEQAWVKFIGPRIGEKGARKLAERAANRPLRRVERLFHPVRQDPRLPRIELIWMPSYIFDFALDFNGSLKPASMAVDACSGGMALFAMHSWMEEGDVEGQVFEPLLTPEAAEEMGRRELISLLLRQRGRQRRAEPQPTQQTHLVHYPFWVYYYLRRGTRMDIIAIDAIHGDRGSSKQCAAILAAFARAGAPSKAT